MYREKFRNILSEIVGDALSILIKKNLHETGVKLRVKRLKGFEPRLPLNAVREKGDRILIGNMKCFMLSKVTNRFVLSKSVKWRETVNRAENANLLHGLTRLFKSLVLLLLHIIPV